MAAVTESHMNGLDRELFEPDWCLTDEQKALRERLIEICEEKIRPLLPGVRQLSGEKIQRYLASELRERIRTLCDAGYQQFAVFVPPGQEDALDDWARVIDGL